MFVIWGMSIKLEYKEISWNLMALYYNSEYLEANNKKILLLN